MPQLAVFATELGWFGLIGSAKRVLSLSIGHASADEVRRALLERASASQRAHIDEADWCPDLRRRLQQYTLGKPASFADYQVDTSGLTEFQQRVVAAVRRIKFGTTRSYGEVAELAGAPRAARAVGSVMAANCTPIIVPCHRVIAAGQRLGGFSGVHGVCLKQQMLELENIAIQS
jgi:methylated-DNA-[protein]-cysteine S-methyltransferase